MKLIISTYGENLEGGVVQYREAIRDLLSDTSMHIVSDDFADLSDLVSSRLGKICKIIFLVTLGYLNLFPWIFKNKLNKLNYDINNCVVYVPNLALFPPCYFNFNHCLIMHVLQDHYFPSYFTLKERLFRKLLRTIVRHKGGVIHCESEAVRLDVNKFLGISKERSFVLPVPCKYELENKPVRNHLEEELITLFYPASFWPHKNHDRLLNACRLVSNKGKNLKVVLTGGKNSSSLMQLVSKFGQGFEIDVIGEVSEDVLISHYRRANLVIVPSLFESISIPIEEALSFQCKVIASNVCGMVTQLDGRHLFDPYDIKSIASVIDAALDSDLLDWDQYRNQRAYARATFKENFKNAILSYYDN